MTLIEVKIFNGLDKETAILTYNINIDAIKEKIKPWLFKNKKNKRKRIKKR